jgi:hydroxymethylglutaryl-CoA synthase
LAGRVGIEALYVYVPEFYVDNAELALARGKEPKHFTEGVGIKTFAVPAPNEDQASIAATAAYRLLESQKIAPEEIFRVDTPTESGLDSSRALVSDVIGMLEQVYGSGSFSHVLGHEQKFACVSGMERLLDTSAWFAAGWNPRKYALVLATDVAKYNLNSREEPTQGAASAAVLVGDDARLLEVIPGALGSAMRHEKGDFKKPGGRTIAMVDGLRSVASYLSEMKEAWLNFQGAVKKIGLINPKNDESILDYIDRAAYHNPNKKMVISAYASLLIHEWRSLPRWKEMMREIGPEPPRTGMDDLAYYMTDGYQEYRRKFMKSIGFTKEFDKKIGSSITAPELVGNSYAVSVFVGLDSIFENDQEDLAAKRVVLCGYGSGSHAVIQANRVPEGYREEAKGLDLMTRLASRVKLSIEEYEAIHQGKIDPNDWKHPAKRRFVLTSIGEKETAAEGDRDYIFSE